MLRILARAAALGVACAASGACADTGGPPKVDRANTPDAAPTPAAAPGAAPPASAAVPPALAPLPADLPFQVGTGPTGRAQVALTFHGQGSPDIATALLTLLEAADARVTVLAVGTWLDEQPHLARRILSGGHELGNHTMNHGDISSMTADQAYAEITRCADRLVRLTGSAGRWFRPSRARDCTPVVATQARRAGYAHALGYDVDSLDYTRPGARAVSRSVLDAVRPGSVVSLHFGYPDTVAALPTILDGLQTRGLRAVTTSELVS
ncbi:polysaccharide deacetylase family protein [Streptomyces sp. SID3343]|uniref:polysaccharide deacetylase family protein n=1 Tax=Streptomyces sp. SID3343 TaxID=2690260 RepID=UPI0031F90D73